MAVSGKLRYSRFRLESVGLHVIAQALDYYHSGSYTCRYLVSRCQYLAKDHSTRNIVTEIERREKKFHEITAILVVAYIEKWSVCFTLLQ